MKLTIQYLMTVQRHARSRGFSLVELMIALTIGLIILVAIGQLFVTSRASYTLEEGLARAQEAGRFSMEYLTSDIRMAGFAGCQNPAGTGTVQGNGAGTTCVGAGGTFCNLANPADESTRFAAEGIRGFTYVGNGTNNLNDWNPPLPAAFFANGQVRPDTDVILIQYASSTGTRLTGNVAPNNANIKISPVPLADGDMTNGEIQPNDILVISDCKNTDVIRVTNTPSGDVDASFRNVAHGNNGNLSSHLTHSYGTDAEVLTLVSRVYYIATNTAGEPALMRKELGSGGAVGAAQELVEGIEDMRIRYGVDTTNDGIANRYVLANDVVDLAGVGTTTWDNVVSVRLGLLIRTPNRVEQSRDTNTYEVVDGVLVDPVDDNRRRQVYRTTVQVRN